jgi:Domain of unknown function (DUF6894)
MPRYLFQVRRGKFSNGSSVEATLESGQAAWKEATAICADLARDIVSAEPEWLLEVADEAGQALFSFRFVAESFQRNVGAETYAGSTHSADRLPSSPV